MCVCVYVCVCERERVCVCVCVYVCAREGADVGSGGLCVWVCGEGLHERKRGRDSVCVCLLVCVHTCLYTHLRLNCAAHFPKAYQWLSPSEDMTSFSTSSKVPSQTLLKLFILLRVTLGENVRVPRLVMAFLPSTHCGLLDIGGMQRPSVARRGSDLLAW